MAYKMKGAPYSKKYSIGKSDIHGKGVIANKDFKKGELVGVAVTDESALQEFTDPKDFRDCRTKLGKFLNHQNKHNASLKSEDNTLNIYTNSPIKKGDEITVNYQKGPNYVDGDLTGFKEK
jgi:hypothetical protein|tara:strand:- start:227 stop:589 length:363 start_codon:yes stop_codon:yes gene_type:complete